MKKDREAEGGRSSGIVGEQEGGQTGRIKMVIAVQGLMLRSRGKGQGKGIGQSMRVLTCTREGQTFIFGLGFTRLGKSAIG